MTFFALGADKKSSIDEDALLDDCLEFDIEDLDSSDDEFYEIEINPNSFDSFCSYLESKKYQIEAELNLQPQNTIKIKESNSSQIINLLSLLEDHDDVQKVYTNLEIEK